MKCLLSKLPKIFLLVFVSLLASILLPSCGDTVENRYEYEEKENRTVCIKGWQYVDIEGSLVEDYDIYHRHKRCSMERIEVESERG